MLTAMLGCWHLQTPPRSPSETSDPDCGLPMGKHETDRALSAHQPLPRPAPQYPSPVPAHGAVCALTCSGQEEPVDSNEGSASAVWDRGEANAQGAARPCPTASAAGSEEPPRPAPVPSHPHSSAASTGMGLPNSHRRAGSIQPMIKGEGMSQNPISCRVPIKNNSRGANRQRRAGKKELETVWCQRFAKELKC